jgi:GNAT superfamily N-acetyltransferase
VRPEHRGHKYGSRLKQEIISEAQGAGILWVTSVVAWTNAPMMWINDQLGGSTFRIPGQPSFVGNEHLFAGVHGVRPSMTSD